MEHNAGKAITDIIDGQPYYFGTTEDRSKARVLTLQFPGNREAFHQAMTDAGLFWGDTDRLYDDDWSLEALTARQRALARYTIMRGRLAADGYTRIKEQLPYSGLRFDEGRIICEQLDDEAKKASPRYQLHKSSWGLTMHHLQLERRVPPMAGRLAVNNPVKV
jgi:hypothetical protein